MIVKTDGSFPALISFLTPCCRYGHVKAGLVRSTQLELEQPGGSRVAGWTIVEVRRI